MRPWGHYKCFKITQADNKVYFQPNHQKNFEIISKHFFQNELEKFHFGLGPLVSLICEGVYSYKKFKLVFPLFIPLKKRLNITSFWYIWTKILHAKIKSKDGSSDQKGAYKTDENFFSKCICFLSFQGTTMIYDFNYLDRTCAGHLGAF